MRTKPRSLPGIVAAIIFSLVLVACGSPQGGSPGAPTAAPADAPTTAPATDAPTVAPAEAPTAAPAATGGVVQIARTAAPDSLNPGAAYLSEAFDLFDLVYDTLIRTDLRNQPVSGLAKEWKSNEEGTVWTFTLHDDAKWHDGTPVTAEDVAFTFSTLSSYDSFALQKDYAAGLVSAEVPDPTTVVLTFDAPIANWLERFSALYILPKHIWSQFPDATAAAEFTNDAMIGSGPFKLAEYKQGEFSRLTAVKDHYDTPPQIDEVIFKIYQNDDATVQALKTGEVDITGLRPQFVRALQAESNVKIEIGNALGFTDIIFNVTAQENCPADVGKCTGHPALKDVKVRQALAHATDKQQLIDVMLFGLGTPGISFVSPGHGEGFNSSIQDYAFDIAKANQILDEAGYADSNGDGIREMPNDPSTPLQLRFNWPSDQFTDGARFAETLGSTWKQAGVELVPQGLEADALTSVCCPAFDFDVILWGWGAGPDPASLLYITTTEQIPTGISESGYSNPEYDQLFVEQGATVDTAKRKELLWKLQEILVRDVPYIIPYYSQAVGAYRSDRVQGFLIDPEGFLSLSGRINLVRISVVQ
ncbi:MAG: ABC transporter substrate-binding protein [Roseiflexaceae bacterium]